MAQPFREPTALARALASGLRAYGARSDVNWKRFTRLAKLARAVHLKNGLASVQLDADTRFIFPLGDHYWHGVFLGRVYEPVVDWLFRRIKDVPYALIDCGANMGYWSLRVSGREFGAHKVAAIEAAKSNFDLLQNNARANGDRFTPLQRAISDLSGDTLKLYGKMHFGRSLNPGWHEGAEAHAEEVETITIDEIADKFLPAGGQPIVIKLDVEGVEVAAMKGGSKTIASGALLVYEDHEKEAAHPASAHLLGMGDMEIWHRTRAGKLTKIHNLEQVAQAKIAAHDFFAYKRGARWSEVFSEGMH
ncbi:MAG: FkbM family methyltransferase [Rhizobiales bacterium]|nr:FkbM family methyltransferase [Hyphomicrobiales bacterium]